MYTKGVWRGGMVAATLSKTEPLQTRCDCTPTKVHGEDIHDLTCSMFEGLPINRNFAQMAETETANA